MIKKEKVVSDGMKEALNKSEPLKKVEEFSANRSYTENRNSKHHKWNNN